jgi:hypothetical protein
MSTWAEYKREMQESPELIMHGTVSGYLNYRCRCALCRSAWAEYSRSYRQRRKARTGERILHGRFAAIGS